MGRIVYERRSRGIVQIEMKEEIRRFAEYLEAEKHASENTRVSYQRDLMQMAAFLEGMGIRELSRVTRTALNSYVGEGREGGVYGVQEPGVHEGVFRIRI